MKSVIDMIKYQTTTRLSDSDISYVISLPHTSHITLSRKLDLILSFQVLEEIDVGKKTRRELERDLDDVKRVVAKMNRQAEARSQFDIHMKDKKELENKVEYL